MPRHDFPVCAPESRLLLLAPKSVCQQQVMLRNKGKGNQDLRVTDLKPLPFPYAKGEMMRPGQQHLPGCHTKFGRGSRAAACPLKSFTCPQDFMVRTQQIRQYFTV